MKEPKKTPDKPPLKADIPSTEIPTSSIVSDYTESPVEKPRDTTIPDSVPIPMLPPRKRLKASRSTRDTDSNIAGVNKSGHTNGKYETVDLSTLLESEQSVQLGVIKSERVSLSQALAAASSTVASIASSDALVATNFNSTAKNSFASLSLPWQQARPEPLHPEPVRRGRKPHRTTSAAVTANPLPGAVCQSWSDRNDGGLCTVVPTPPAAVAAPTPNIIQIPEDARVFQTEDGMIIVCQSDGTVQIHGHTEGRPIPLDAIRSLLALDTPGDQALYTVSDQISQDTGQSMPLTIPQSGYDAAEQIIFADGSQNMIPVDGSQHLTMDGNQVLMAYDPHSQSIVPINPGQTFITLSDSNALVAMDSVQPVLSIDGACHTEQALIQLLPNNHMQ